MFCKSGAGESPAWGSRRTALPVLEQRDFCSGVLACAFTSASAVTEICHILEPGAGRSLQGMRTNSLIAE